MGAYNKILKQAYEITRQHKFAWILGLFLSLSILYLTLEFVILDYFDIPSFLAVAIWLAVFLFFVRSHVSLIIAIKAIIDKQGTSVKKSFNSSVLFYGRILLISILMYFGSIVVSGILLAPSRYLYQHNEPTQALTLFILGLAILLPLLMLAFVASVLSFMFVINYDLKVKEALGRTADMIVKQWLSIFGLLVFLIILDLPALFLLQYMVGLRGGLLFYLSMGILFLLFQSVYMVFQQTAWMLLFNDLIKPQKFEIEQTMPAPEIVG
ncbi:MAG: hypothetical protein KW804_00835 [Candidatus Doudnabacteria bacterium]|nr:hypothetical protein [Candidatus Doudnabacteria bacterium]